MWCGGGSGSPSHLRSLSRDCHTNSRNKCEPYDFAVNGEGRDQRLWRDGRIGHAFNTFHAVGTYKMAACEVQIC